MEMDSTEAHYPVMLCSFILDLFSKQVCRLTYQEPYLSTFWKWKALDQKKPDFLLIWIENGSGIFVIDNVAL